MRKLYSVQDKAMKIEISWRYIELQTEKTRQSPMNWVIAGRERAGKMIKKNTEGLKHKQG